MKQSTSLTRLLEHTMLRPSEELSKDNHPKSYENHPTSQQTSSIRNRKSSNQARFQRSEACRDRCGKGAADLRTSWSLWRWDLTVPSSWREWERVRVTKERRVEKERDERESLVVLKESEAPSSLRIYESCTFCILGYGSSRSGIRFFFFYWCLVQVVNERL